MKSSVVPQQFPKLRNKKRWWWSQRQLCWKCTCWIVKFSPLIHWVLMGTWWMNRRKSSSSLFCRRLLWAVLAWVGTSSLWHCPSSNTSVDHGVTRPPRCTEGYLKKEKKKESVVVCDMPEPWELPSLDSCQMKFLWAHKEVDLVLHTHVVLFF